jgi:hypothetical protein
VRSLNLVVRRRGDVVHLAKIAFWVVPAVLVAAAIKAASGMPLWAAALIGIFAMGVNILVARVEEENQSRTADAAPATLGRRLVRGSLRIAAILIGVGALTIGATSFGDTWPSPHWWLRYAAPLGLALFGVYLLAYGFTGREKPYLKRRL